MGMCRETGVGRIRDCIYPPFLWAAGTPSCVTASSLSLLFLLGNLFYLAPAKLGPINTPLLLQNVPLLFVISLVFWIYLFRLASGYPRNGH